MDSKTYWMNRETEQRKHNIRDEKEYAKHIDGIYQNMLDEIEKEINGFYGKYAGKEGITLAEAKKRASKADIEALGRKAAKYVKDKNFSKQANEEMRLYNLTMKVNRLELLKAQIGLEMVSGFDELQQYYEEILTDRVMSEFERLSGILGKTIQDNAKAAKAIVNASFHNAAYSDRIWMYQDMLKNELSSLLQTGLIQGQNPRKLATHLRKRFGVSRSNAERLMTTEMARVQTEAQKQSFERNGFEEYIFLALGTACPICRELDEEHFKVAKMMPGTNAPPMHPNCVLPDTKIIAPDIEAMTRSSYSGCVVEIRTSNGARLTVTPNHIVLTARGWVRAKNLVKGDKVINYSSGIKSVIESNPANNNSIPTIEELFTSLIESGAVPTLSVPISPEDFKGDIPSDGEIDIIFIDGKLRDKLNATLSQLIGDVLLVGAPESGEVALSRNSSLAEHLVGLGLAADGIMSGSRIAEILLMGTLTHRQLISLRLPSDYDARLYKTASNDASADIKLFSDGIFAHPGSIHISNLLDVKRDFDSLKRNAASVETTLDGRSCDSVGLRDFISAFSRFVTLDDIVFITNKFYSGHVYDASSLSTLYIANGIITSNCRCSVAAYEDSDDYEEWLDYLSNGGTTEEWNKSRAFAEKEESKRKYKYKDTVINTSEISSAGYRRKFTDITGENKISRSLWEKALEMLEHRSGTKYEDLAFIDSKTGKSIINKSFDKESTASPNKSMKKMLGNAESYSIIAIHNHPGSSAPSLSDIMACKERKYKYGLVACHDGTIYKYSVDEERINIPMAVSALDRVLKKGYTETTSKECADAGIRMEVF